MKLSDYVVNFIAELGLRHVFMLPGGGAMHLNDSLGRCSKLEYVCCVHEQGAAIAAEAYSQVAGLGAIMVTTGPGGTNAITGVAGAWLESTPLLVISGQVKSNDLVGNRKVRQIGFQEIDIVQMVAPITKYARTILDPSEIRSCLEEAVWLATHHRKGPVWIDIPLDIQAADIVPENLRPFVPPPDDAVAIGRIEATVRKTITLLAQAQRPVVLVGNGVRHAGAIASFLSWVEAVGIPVLCTWKMLDIIAYDHPLYVGRPGAVGQRGANFAQQTSDLFISIGARLDFGQTAYSHSNFAARAKKIIVDIDSAEIEKLKMDIDVVACEDAGLFLRELLRQSERMLTPDWNSWRSRCVGWKQKYPMVLADFRNTKHGINNYVLVESIGSLLRDGDLLVPGSSGACSEVTSQSVQVLKKIRFINTHGLGAMGFGVPAAIGACLASGRSRCVCIDGDGGFAMNSQELAVVSRLNLPIKFFILNNGGYGSIRSTQVNYFESNFVACGPDSGLTLPNIKATAEACSIPYSSIASQSKIIDEVAVVLEHPGPIICEVFMADGQMTQPKVSSRQLPSGKMQTMPMEDLWPFLSKAEFESNMFWENQS